MSTRRGRPPGTRRSGFTLIELLVALTVFGIVISVTVSFVARENTVFQQSLERVETLRNLRYAVDLLSRDLETLGTNVPGGQPTFFYGDEDVIAFAADHTTNVANDPFAVHYDPDAPSGSVRAPLGAFGIPNALVSWPDTAWESSPGVPSPAEVIVFFFRPDSSTARTDDWILFRQVNSRSPELVARDLLRAGTDPFFSYERLGTDAVGAAIPVEVPDSLLPLHHSATVHLAAGDTAGSARADSVRAVRVRLAATDDRSDVGSRVVTADRLVALPNAGLGRLATCGSTPLLGTSIGTAVGTDGTGLPFVTLTWSPATDESGGERDVVRYVIWRRAAGDPDWGDPFLAIPAGAGTYAYDDATVASGSSYEYALAAQDCTPTLSSLAQSGTVIVP